jgi:hypothetical protein
MGILGLVLIGLALGCYSTGHLLAGHAFWAAGVLCLWSRPSKS